LLLNKKFIRIKLIRMLHKIIVLEDEKTPGWVGLELEHCCREDEDGILECDSYLLQSLY